MKPDLRSLLAHSSLFAEPGVGQEQDRALQSAAMRRIIQRVRKVIACPDLAIPLAASQAVVDPNTIGEYLDGVLSPDRAAEIEELCLAADKYLAEVAGCQQVLYKTAETSEVWPRQQESELPSSAAFRRMYGLPVAPVGRVEPSPFAETRLPKSARPRKSFNQRRWAVAGLIGAIACLLVGVWLYRDLASNFQLGERSREPGWEDEASLAAKESPPSNAEAERHRPAVKARVPSQLGNVATVGVASKGLLWRQGLSS